MTDTHYQPYDAAGNKYGEEKPMQNLYAHTCQPCDKCDGCKLECEHKAKFNITTTTPPLRGETPELERFQGVTPPPATGEAISLCKWCWAMTHTVGGMLCGKCGKAEEAEGADPLSERTEALLQELSDGAWSLGLQGAKPHELRNERQNRMTVANAKAAILALFREYAEAMIGAGQGLGVSPKKARERIARLERRAAWIEDRSGATSTDLSFDKGEASALRWSINILKSLVIEAEQRTRLDHKLK